MMIMSAISSVSFAESTDISAQAANGSIINISGVNRPIQAADELILFTRDNSSDLTDANVWCTAAIVTYQDGKYIITDIKSREGAVKIPFNGFVLFGHGISEDWINSNLKTGEELKINGYTLPEIITGSMIMLENGAKYDIAGIDTERQANGLQIFTSGYGDYTKPFSADTEEIIVVNNIVVDRNSDGSKGTYIPDNGYVISGTGTAASIVSNIANEQKITLMNIEIPTLPGMYFKVGGIMVPIDKKNADRGANEVIYYDSSFGSSTGANPWGMEITAVNGKVTAIAAIACGQDGTFINNNSPIPQDGCVLSIQSGSPYYTKLNGVVKVGDEIEVVTRNTFIYKAGLTGYDALNPKCREDNPAGWDDGNNAPFPGYRGADQLIVYDDTYGVSTGTNAWGYEVVVNSDNKIIKAGGNDSYIPKGGYILSGHGVKADWLRANADIGSTVKLDKDKKQVLVVFKPASCIDRVLFKIDTVKEEFKESKARFLDVPYEKVQAYIDNADKLVESARNELAGGNYEKMFEIIGQIEAAVSKAHFADFESKKVENRAVWLRPKETSVDKVAANLDKLKALNINTVYLETWWAGYTIFPTDNTITSQNPMYNGFDVLKAYIDEAHKRGMQVHSWVENFFIGDEATNNGGPIYNNKPEWLMMSRKGDNFEYVEMYNMKYYFANPALPVVRDFVMDIYKELVKKYDIDGLQLDYVRYPDAGDGSNDFGYDQYTRDLFIKETGVDPISVYPGDALWQKWCDFRANIINTFVYRVVSETRALKPELKISADVGNNYAAAPNNLMQRPKDWVSKGYIDNIVPMSYTQDIKCSSDDAVNTVAFAKGHSYVTMGLGTCMGLSKEVLVGQVGGVNSNGADGTALFEFESLLSAGYGNELMEGVYRNEALICDNDPMLSVMTILADIYRKINTIYIANGGIKIPDAGISAAKTDFVSSFASSISKAANSKDYKEIEAVVGKFTDMVNDCNYMDKEVKNRILTDLDSCWKILDIRNSREQFGKTHAIESIVFELPAESLKVGNTVKVRVKAVFKDGKDVIMYLDPSQFTLGSSNNKVVQVQGDSFVVKSKGRAVITAKIAKDFIFSIEGSGNMVVQNINITD